MGMENEFMINTAMFLEYLLAYLYVYFAHCLFPSTGGGVPLLQSLQIIH